MKILRIVSSTDPKLGGVIEAVNQASYEMINHGHTVDILSSDSPESEWLRSSELCIHAVGPGISTYAYCPNMKKWIDENHQNYDAFLIDGIWQYHSHASRSALIKNKRKYHVYTHGMLDPWFKKKYPLKHIKKWLYWPWGDYRVLRDAESVFFTTKDELVESAKSFWLYKCTAKVVPIGISPFKGNEDRAKSSFLNAFPMLNNKQFILFMGRINQKKGIDLLINAFAQTSKNYLVLL